MSYTYRGKTTRSLYVWALGLLPGSLVSPAGGPVASGTWNGETVVFANRDGSLPMPAHGPSPAGDPYTPGVIRSPWELP